MIDQRSVFTRIKVSSLILLSSVFATTALAQDQTVTPPGIETDGYAEIDARGAGLFAVPIPGETFDPLSGALGHRHTDMMIEGNGMLPIVIDRRFEEIARSYPHHFGNMSLNIPRLIVDTRVSAAQGGQSGEELSPSPDPAAISCDWVTDIGLNASGETQRRVWNDIKFSYHGGTLSFFDKYYLTNTTLYPDRARYVSKENWFISCDIDNPDIFLVNAPDGTVYEFFEQERVYAARGFGVFSEDNAGTGFEYTESTHSTSKYMVYVSEVRKRGARLNYFYEQAPKPSDNPNYYKAFPPYFIGEFEDHDGDGQVHRNTIRNKIRPVQIHATTEPAVDPERVLLIEYDSGTDCPYLISRISSPNAKNTEVNYSYARLIKTEGDHSIDQCQLTNATFADGSGFSYTYGVSDSVSFSANGDYSNVPSGQEVEDYVQLHAPLQTVKIPTGALASYEYRQLGVCEYQDVYDSERRTPYVNLLDCGTDNQLRRPVLIKRTLSEGDIPTTVVDIEYDNMGANGITQNRVRRVIDNPTRQHELEFGRIDRYTPYVGPVGDRPPYDMGTNTVTYPDGSQVSYPEDFEDNYGGRLLHSGRLLSQVTRLHPDEGGAILSRVDFQYFENTTPFINYSKMPLLQAQNQTPAQRLDSRPLPKLTTTSPDGEIRDNPNYRVYSNRWMFVFDAVRVNTQQVAIAQHEAEFITRTRSFDQYNLPTRIDQEHLGSNIDERKTTEISYDHTFNPIGNGIYDIGLKKNVTTGPTDASANATTGESIIDIYGYNTERLPNTKTKTGFITAHAYYPSGEEFTFTDGNIKTWANFDYKMGIPLRRVQAGGGTVRSEVNDRGLIETVIDAEDNRVNYRYDTLGRVTSTWTGLESNPFQVKTIHPVWHDSGSANFRKQIDQHIDTSSGEIRYEVETQYDALGRPELTRFTDNFVENGQTIWHRYVYDWMGRTIFLSDASSVNNGTNPDAWTGTSYQYDGFDRLAIARHTGDNSAVNYCYGPTCSTGSYTVNHGYLMTDQAENKTAVNFRAYGHPSNGEVVEMIQEIEGDEAVVTTISRNSYGFIESVWQGSVGGDVGFSRTYTPYVFRGSLTSLVQSETHPEFGTKTVDQFDGNGNPTRITEFHGGTTHLDYTERNQLSLLRQTAGSGMVPLITDYQYFFNDNLKATTTLAADEVTPITTRHYEYNNQKNLLTAEILELDGETYSIGYGYDGYDALSTTTYPDGLSVNYQMNGRGLVRDASASSDAIPTTIPIVSSASYHPNGQLAIAAYGNGQETVTTQNSRSLLEDLTTTIAGSVKLHDTQNLSYTYDNRRNVEQIDGYLLPQLDSDGGIYGMEYDGLNRLRSVNGPWASGGANITQSYDYDEIGNILSSYDSQERFQDYEYGANNQLVSVYDEFENQIRSMTYDGNGNVTSAKPNSFETFQYDTSNQLVLRQAGDAELGGEMTSYQYDGNNYLAKKTTSVFTPPLAPSVPDQTRVTFYSMTGNLMYEINPDTGESKDHIYVNGQRFASIGAHFFTDTDNDGLLDYYERLHNLNPSDPSDGAEDLDNDGLSNFEESVYGTHAANPDSDDDGMSDGFEQMIGSDLVLADREGDADGDGIPNYLESESPNPSTPSAGNQVPHWFDQLFF